MLIETFQKRRFLKQSGDILTTSRQCEMGIVYPEVKFQQAYDWLRDQYVKRRGPLDPRQALIWGWPSPYPIEAYQLNPPMDKRVAAVHLWVEVPDELILETNFESWSIVLNRLPFDEASGLTLEKDWEKLFDTKWLEQHEYAYELDANSAQTVFPYIKREWIKKVKYIRGPP